MGQSITWERQGNNWDSAAMCLYRGTGDCKCTAVTSAEVLRVCGFPEVRVAVLERLSGEGTRHAVTFFQDKAARRGYINDTTAMTFKAGAPWPDVMAAIQGGPWVLVDQKN